MTLNLKNTENLKFFWNFPSLFAITVGARIPNKFGIRMVHSSSVLVPTIRKPNFASLGRFIYKEEIFLCIKWPSLEQPFCFFDHSKTEQNGRHLDWPFENRTFHASLGRFISVKIFYLYIKWSRLTAIRNPNDWLQTDHSKTEPFENRTKKGSDFEWVPISSVRNSSPDCNCSSLLLNRS